MSAFILHYAWEQLQCAFFVHRPDDAAMWLAMVKAAAGDVVLTWLAQLLVAAFSGRWVWAEDARIATWLWLMVVGASMAVGLEWYALETGRWIYSDTSPIIPWSNVSALPVAQLVLLLPTCCLLAARVACNDAVGRRRSNSERGR